MIIMKTEATKMAQIKDRLSRKAVRQIAEMAGVSKSSVYRVLAGKNENIAIYDAILIVLEEEISRVRAFETQVEGLLS
jgi:AcrR family transcriptional regulator